MASCDVRIELAKTEAAAGSVLEGHVVCNAAELVETKGVKLIVGWKTHGRGNRDASVVHEEVLYIGKLSGEHRLPFRVALPNGPLTFHGELINVEWYAKATIDLAWAIDPKHEASFVLRPGGEPYVHGDNDQRLGPASSHPDGRSLGCLLLFLFPFLVVGAGLIVSGLTGGEPFPAVIIGGMFTVIPLLMLFFILRGRIAARKVGEVEVVLSTLTPRPGSTLTITVRMVPAASFELNDVTAALSGFERAVSGSGTRKTTHTRTLYEDRVSLSGGKRNVRVGEPIELTGVVTIPRDAPPSFHSHDNEVLCAIDVRVDVPSWPDWIDRAIVAVLPPEAR